ncbi:MAG: hypothetical protein GYA55_13045 [SAR324 cluster bacterium]|uniref:Adenosine deaminase domain-containing protein n=1 Tax=SAR324 cluster bacterium TaxID=2024889 RepID=A0A7X9FUF5_9DELT|nr:hypothetical protein [SAR324 cluster bacterium]
MKGAFDGEQANHPVVFLLCQGMSFSLATDDPIVQGIKDPKAELPVAQELLGAERSDLNQQGKNANNAAFIRSDLRKQYKDKSGIG